MYVNVISGIVIRSYASLACVRWGESPCSTSTAQIGPGLNLNKLGKIESLLVCTCIGSPTQSGDPVQKRWLRTRERLSPPLADSLLRRRLLTASVSPYEFNVKRDRIAEMLFTCKMTKCFGCDRVELTVPKSDCAEKNIDDDDDDKCKSVDPWRNPAVEEQVIMRIHRIGQRTVHNYKFGWPLAWRLRLWLPAICSNVSSNAPTNEHWRAAEVRGQQHADVDEPPEPTRTHAPTGLDDCPSMEDVCDWPLRGSVILDESNSVGVLGRSGRGLTEHMKVSIDKVDIVTASLGHTVATEGGFCIGSNRMKGQSMSHNLWISNERCSIGFYSKSDKKRKHARPSNFSDGSGLSATFSCYEFLSFGIKLATMQTGGKNNWQESEGMK
ncbi:8-amino-7-oxononanoate synthase [Striga asiatica]|uniref:8-amino-7-oxononanoate synthase n=1 Tax=Striga asiatica TaxID=4170 RepID=A0A5A7PTB4_STRAF|nr:8-amino-7-oxononanoate synthase [Striga asiatica]